MKESTSFRGRLFYAIVPDKNYKSINMYYSKTNFMEGHSGAHGLPLFIRDHFKREPAFFYSSTALTEALEGEWDYKKLKILKKSKVIDLMRWKKRITLRLRCTYQKITIVYWP